LGIFSEAGQEFHPIQVDRFEVIDIADKVYKIDLKSLRRKISL
jgi:hypothetical protein